MLIVIKIFRLAVAWWVVYGLGVKRRHRNGVQLIFRNTWYENRYKRKIKATAILETCRFGCVGYVTSCNLVTMVNSSSFIFSMPCLHC